MFDELYEQDIAADNAREDQQLATPYGTPLQDPRKDSDDPPAEQEGRGPITRARSALKKKAKLAKQSVEDQRKAAEATELKRRKLFQKDWERAKSTTSGQRLQHILDDDPEWSGATSLYSSVTQVLEKGLSEQILRCRVGCPG